MNCEKSRQWFVDYLGEELGKQEAAELKQHLRACPDCRKEMMQLAEARSALRYAWPDEELPQPLTFHFPEPSSNRRNNVLPWFGLPRAVFVSFSAAACFLLCLVGLTIFRTQIEIKQGTFRISFGRDLASDSSGPRPVALQSASGLSQGETQAMIEKAVQQLEATQNARFEQALLAVKSEVDETRKADLVRIAKQMTFLENAQSIVYKETALNNSHLDTLAREFYSKTSRQQ